MRAASITSFLKIKQGEKHTLEDLLKKVGNPLKPDNGFLAFGPHTHFARFVILPGADEDIVYPGQEYKDSQADAERTYRLMVNAVFDQDAETFVQEMINASGADNIDKIFAHCEGYVNYKRLYDYLREHAKPSQIFYDTFVGESVRSITEKRNLRNSLQNILDVNDYNRAVDLILSDNIKPVRENPPVDTSTPARIRLAVGAIMALAAIALPYLVLANVTSLLGLLWVAFVVIVAVLVLVPVVQTIFFHDDLDIYGGIVDQVNEHDEHDPKSYPLKMVSGREDVLIQNQFNLYLTFKGGWLERQIRVLRMRILMFILGNTSQIDAMPGSLGGLTTVHFGHWVLIDGGRRLFFITNYDGSWETYIADFVNKIYPILDVQLSNFIGFSSEGTRDIAAFRRWLRRVQIQSSVFYSAYPFTTVRHTQRDLQINKGFPKDSSDLREWFKLFNAPRFNGAYEKKQELLPTLAPNLTKSEWDDIQSFIVYGYARFLHGRYLFLHIDDPHKAKAWLEQLTPLITTVEQWDADELKYELETAVNIALNHTALARLNLPEDTLKSFPVQFQEGIAPEPKGSPGQQDRLHPRSILLGDIDESSPYNWSLGNPKDKGTEDEFHIMLILSGVSVDALETLVTSAPFTMLRDGSAGLRITYTQQGAIPPTGREPFGFRDGISNPWIEGTRYSFRGRDGERSDPLKLSDKQIIKEQAEGEPDRVISLVHDPVIRTGEFILGYPNEYGQLPQTPLVWDDPTGLLKPLNGEALPGELDALKDLGRNGSYLVYRKLQQDVSDFWQYMEKHTQNHDEGKPDTFEMQRIASKMVGRWPSGVPTTLSPESDDYDLKAHASKVRNHSLLNDFSYRPDDEEGLGCPFGSHLRRGNPRDSLIDDKSQESVHNSNLHRVIRRSVTFGKLGDHQIDPDYFKEHGAPLEITHKLAGNYPEDPDGVGIHFFAVNANIQQQFEFVQQAWNNNGQFNGMYGTKDPITGDNPDHLPEEKREDMALRYAEREVAPVRLETNTMVIPAEPVRRQLTELPRFVHVRGGGYLFLPSITALRYLSQVGKQV